MQYFQDIYISKYANKDVNKEQKSFTMKYKEQKTDECIALSKLTTTINEKI